MSALSVYILPYSLKNGSGYTFLRKKNKYTWIKNNLPSAADLATGIFDWSLGCRGKVISYIRVQLKILVKYIRGSAEQQLLSS